MAEPITLQEALRAWDEGETLRAFRVDSDGAAQDEIYAAAPNIAYVANRNGWSRTVLDHIHERSPEITIRKPGKPAAQTA